MTDEVPLFRNWVRGYEDVCRIRKIRLSKDQVSQIRSELKKKKTVKEVAIEFGVSYAQVYCIHRNITFKEK